MTLGQYEQVINDFGDAIRVDPQDAEAYFNRGIGYVRNGQRERGVQDFDEAITLNPGYTQVYYHRAFAHTRLGEDSLAEHEIHSAGELGMDRELLVSQIEQAKQGR